MRLHAFHGVLEQERKVGNDYVVSLNIGYPVDSCLASDDVNDTLNYASVADTVKEEMSVPSALVEHVAGRIINSLCRKFEKITSIRIRLIKIAPPMPYDMDGAGVELEYIRPVADCSSPDKNSE